MFSIVQSTTLSNIANMSAMAVFMIVSNVRNARPSAPSGACPYNRWAGGAGVKQHKMLCNFGDTEPPNPAACDHE